MEDCGVYDPKGGKLPREAKQMAEASWQMQYRQLVADLMEQVDVLTQRVARLEAAHGMVQANQSKVSFIDDSDRKFHEAVKKSVGGTDEAWFSVMGVATGLSRKNEEE